MCLVKQIRKYFTISLKYTQVRIYAHFFSSTILMVMKMKAKLAVVARIDELCQLQNITYNELARRSGITPSTVYSLILPQRKEVSITTISKLCDGFEISIKEFFDSKTFENIDPEIY